MNSRKKTMMERVRKKYGNERKKRKERREEEMEWQEKITRKKIEKETREGGKCEERRHGVEK